MESVLLFRHLRLYSPGLGLVGAVLRSAGPPGPRFSYIMVPAQIVIPERLFVWRFGFYRFVRDYLTSYLLEFLHPESSPVLRMEERRWVLRLLSFWYGDVLSNNIKDLGAMIGASYFSQEAREKLLQSLQSLRQWLFDQDGYLFFSPRVQRFVISKSAKVLGLKVDPDQACLLSPEGWWLTKRKLDKLLAAKGISAEEWDKISETDKELGLALTSDDIKERVLTDGWWEGIYEYGLLKENK
jgi:hypothetical protein